MREREKISICLLYLILFID